jgi:FtsP/CotA-like multicopper oxidase with cupredoxin domain
MIGRRQFLVMGAVGAAAGAAAACSNSQAPPAAPTSTDVSLAAGETDIDLGGVKVRTWAYGNKVPGQQIRLRKGQRLRAELTNAMPQDVTGPVNGYTWRINGRLYNPPNDGVAVKPNQRVRIRFVNESMMFHPFHLHGHTFQVMTTDARSREATADARSREAPANVPKARKDTVLVPPKQTVEVDFDTNNPGRWISHCHNTYHLEAGMAFFVEYAG